MLESFDSGNPIRVIRSFNLAVTNPYRPERGYRYDGLYTVVGKQLVRPENAVWRFLLRRLQGQNPIRCEKGSSWARPTVREIEAYDREVGEREFRMAMERR